MNTKELAKKYKVDLSKEDNYPEARLYIPGFEYVDIASTQSGNQSILVVG